MLFAFLFLNYHSSQLQKILLYMGFEGTEYTIYNWASLLFIYNLTLIPLYMYEIYCRFDVSGELLRTKYHIKFYYDDKEGFEKEIQNYYSILHNSIEKREYGVIDSLLQIFKEIFSDLIKKKREGKQVFESYPKKLLIRLDYYAMMAPNDAEIARRFSIFYSSVHKKLNAKELKENGHIILRTLRRMAVKSIEENSESFDPILVNLFIFNLLSERNTVENYIGIDYTNQIDRNFRSILKSIKNRKKIKGSYAELLQEAMIRLLQAWYYLKKYDLNHSHSISTKKTRIIGNKLLAKAMHRVNEYDYHNNKIKEFFTEELEESFKKIKFPSIS